jgi:anti-sigma factor RsiW
MIRRALARVRFMRDHRWTGAHMSAYLDDELRPDERRRLEEHVHWCPQCRHMLETLRLTLAGLMGLRTAPETDVAPGVIERLRREG